jgi:hypothetical protein
VPDTTVCIACQLRDVMFLSHVTLPRFTLSSASLIPAYCSVPSRAEDVVLISETVIIYYDYLLTLPAEVDRFWRPRSHTWASTLFLVLRYVALLGHAPLFVRLFEDPCVLTVSLICLVSDYLSLANLLVHVSLYI